MVVIISKILDDLIYGAAGWHRTFGQTRLNLASELKIQIYIIKKK